MVASGRQWTSTLTAASQVARGCQWSPAGRQWVARSPVYHKPKEEKQLFAGNGFPKCGESPHRAPAPICEAIKCSVMSRAGCRASGEHWRAWFWAISKALHSSLEGAWTSISTVPQVSFMVESASSIKAIERRRPMSGAAELLASSGGLDSSGFKSALHHSRRSLHQHLNSASSLLHGRVCILDRSHRTAAS